MVCFVYFDFPALVALLLQHFYFGHVLTIALLEIKVEETEQVVLGCYCQQRLA